MSRRPFRIRSICQPNNGMQRTALRAAADARSVGRRGAGPLSDREFEGGCLCASTRFRVSETAKSRCYCHCNSCRLAFGAPFVAWATFPTAEFRLIRGELAQYQSSEGVLRGFCASCGTGVTYRNQGRIDQIDVAVATLDNPGSLQPEYHIWISHKLSWVTPGNQLPQFAEWRTSAVPRRLAPKR